MERGRRVCQRPPVRRAVRRHNDGADFRYIWWLIVSTLIGALLFAFDRSSLSTDAGAGQQSERVACD